MTGDVLRHANALLVVRLALPRALLACFFIQIGAGVASADATRLKITIHNETSEDFDKEKSSATKDAPKKISAHSEGTVVTRSPDSLDKKKQGNVQYNDGSCWFKLQFQYKVTNDSFNLKEYCVGKSFTITYKNEDETHTCTVAQDGNCKGNSGCNCHFKLTAR